MVRLRADRIVTVAVLALLVACVVVSMLPAGAAAEQASEPASPAAGGLDAGGYHGCALLGAGSVRCWGFGGDGQLGYANTDTVGDDETPGSVGPVNLGGRTAKAIATGDSHTCAVLDDGTVRCWGFGGNGRLGYGNINNIRDPSSVGPVDLGSGHAATAITAGAGHTCAVLDDGSVRCWGFGGNGRLGYGNQTNIGDTETPAEAGAVDLGGRTAAISAGHDHTCALLDDGNVRCWGRGAEGALGYGDALSVGDLATPASVEPVNLGGHKATAISAGGRHTCAVLDDGTVRCWGDGSRGELGYDGGNTNNIGDTPASTPDKVGAVDLGPRRTAVAISAGDFDSCAVLDDGSVRCWGFGGDGRLGYANTNNVGDDETPGSVGPVNLGAGRKAVAISAGQEHTCARLDDGNVRCWGTAADGRLGYCNQDDIGDDEAPASAGPVNLQPGDGGARCKSAPDVGLPMTSATVPAQTTQANKAPAVGSDAVRLRGLRRCFAAVAAHVRREKVRAGQGSGRQRARARRQLRRDEASGRRRCLRRYGRTPGQVTGLRARPSGTTQIELSFNAPGTDGTRPPPAHSYVIKQSLRPIRNARTFARAPTLCKGHCRFTVSRVGGRVSLTVTDLRRHSTYYYAMAARDNVSAKRGPRSQTIKARTG